MPRATRATTRSTAQRPAPYPTRSVSTGTQPNDMAVAVSAPMVTLGGWDPVQHQHFYLNQQQQEQYDHYQQGIIQAQYSAMPTPVSGALPAQSTRATVMPVSSSHANSNGGNGPWTAEMDEILIENHRRLKWDQIADKFFAGTKTGNACRKRFARVVHERKDPSRWEPEKVQKVIDAYNRESMRERIWRPLADEVGERWQDIERLCYSQGFKQMTGKTSYGHRKRLSQAVSHRSHPSINSDIGHDGGYDEDDPTDDSGIGGEVSNNHHLMPLPPHPHEYATRESYHEAIPDYGPGPEAYYRHYREG